MARTSKDHNPSVKKNILHLGLLQIVNYLVPIIAIPIILKRIGLDNYGIISVAQATMIILVSISDFGLNLTGTRLISQNLGNKEFLKRTATNILASRILLVIGCFLVLLFLVNIIPLWQNHQLMFLLSFSIVVGQALFPVWYFQGIQKMQFLLILNTTSRIIYLLAIVTLIKSPEQYVWVNFINGVSWFAVSLISALVVIFRLGIDLEDLTPGRIIKFLRSNASIFLANSVNNLYRNGSIILAGFFLGQSALGIYSVIDKLIQFARMFFTIFFRGLFPRISSLSDKPLHHLLTVMKKLFLYVFPLIAFGAIVTFFYGSQLLQIFSSELMISDTAPFMGMLAIIPILFLINLPISLVLVSFNYKTLYLGFNLTLLVLFCLVGIPLTYLYQVEGILSAILITEIVTFLIFSVLLFYEITQRDREIDPGI